jgi:hypothetical protein
MKKLLIVLSLLILNLSIIAQNAEKETENKTVNVDYIITEMTLGAVLGGFKDGKFVNAEIAGKALAEGEELTLFGFDVEAKGSSLKVTKVSEPDEVCPKYYPVQTDKKVSSGVALSSNARWNATPRLPTKINLNSRVYRKIVRDFLRSKGIRNPKVRIEQAFRVDLEGDGQDEVIIQATNYVNFGPSAKKGDYSFVMVRKIVGKKVKNILMVGDFVTKDIEFGAPERYKISAIADLDLSGKMEIVLFGEYYEGSWAAAYQIKNNEAKAILQTGCGV